VVEAPKVEPPKPIQAKVEPPKQPSPFVKSETGEITSSKKVEVPKVEAPKVEPPKPAPQSSFVKSETGEIVSSKKVEAAPVEAKQEEKKVFGDAAPKKLVVSDVFKTQPKQPEFPVKKAYEPPKKLNNPFEKKAEDVVIQSTKQPEPVVPKKLEAPSAFTQPPKPVEEKPVPKKLEPPVLKQTPPPVISSKPTPPVAPVEQKAKVSKLFASDSEDEEE